jgi:hypothetical protein
MTTFLSDLWADLREKRLWPVALLLLVAVVAVPVVLAKPDAEPAPAPPAPPSEQSDADSALKVIAAANDVGEGSPLNLFDKEDPFRPPKQALAKADEADGAADTAAGPDQGADTTGEAIGEAGEVAPPAGSGGGTTGGDTTGGGQSDGEEAPSKPTTKRFTYVIDVTFKNGDRTRRIKGMERLEMLPNEESPLLLFLGVDAKANNAVFLVDSRVQVHGEGRCRPARDECSFLYLGPGSEAVIDDPEAGKSYTLQVREIRRVEIKRTDARAKAGRERRKGDQARTSQYDRPTTEEDRFTAEEERRPFLPRLLTELVSVTTPSSSSPDGR